MNEHPAAFHDRWKKRGRAIDREWEEERDERMRGGNGRQRGRQGGEERERERIRTDRFWRVFGGRTEPRQGKGL